MKYLALIRGINVGGNNLIRMPELRASFERAGFTNVTTYIQSGNVVFCAPPGSVKKLAVGLEKAIEARFGFPVPVVVRSHEQLRNVVQANPFRSRGASEKMLHVIFLADEPDASAVSKLDPQRSPGDEFRVIGSEIFLYLPNGAGNSKLTNAYFDSKLSTIGTARNWTTVLKLLEMTAA